MQRQEQVYSNEQKPSMTMNFMEVPGRSLSLIS
ncbi:hypothetical protein N779_27615 [Vibrio coralliilyticus OCN008]|nr:hypothetical protein N779_27615 [Vibrio coralliilyticus OCN008]